MVQLKSFFKSNGLRIFASLQVLIFFLLLLSPWWFVRKFEVSFSYTSKETNRITLAADHKGDIFSREKLIFSGEELPKREKPSKITISVPAAYSNLRGIVMEFASGNDLKIVGMKIKGAKKCCQIDFSGNLVQQGKHLKATAESLTLTGNSRISVPLSLPGKIRLSRKLQAIPFVISLAAALILAGIFYRKVQISFSPGKLYSFIFASGAIILMVFPVLGMDIISKVSEENRFLQFFPKLTNKNGINTSFPKEFEKFLSDRFFNRENLIKMNSDFFSLRWLNLSDENTVSESRKGFYGKDGWMFSTTYNSIGMIQNKNRFSEAELQQCAEKLNALAKEFQNRFNAPLYLVLMPDKERVYEEFYPGYLLKQRLHPQSRLEQLAEYLRKNSQVKIIYPLPELLKQKKSHLLYYPTGTHQTLRGSLICADLIKKVMSEDFPQISSAPDNTIRWETRKNADLDIAKLLGISDPEKTLDEKYLCHPEPVFKTTYRIENVGKFPQLSLFIYRYSAVPPIAGKGLRILAVTDSFWGNIFEFLNPAVCEQLHVFYGDGRNFFFEPVAAEVKKFRPHAVIIESTERFLDRFLTIRYGE